MHPGRRVGRVPPDGRERRAAPQCARAIPEDRPGEEKRGDHGREGTESTSSRDLPRVGAPPAFASFSSPTLSAPIPLPLQIGSRGLTGVRPATMSLSEAQYENEQE